MNGTQTALAIGLCVLACISTCILVWHMAWKDGYDAGREYESSRQYWKLIRARREQDRPKPVFDGSDGHPPWYAKVSARKIPGTQSSLLTITPPTLSTVPMTLLTLPGGYIPAAPPKRATDTGELRALTAATDHYLAGMHADGEAYRQEMTS